jgi:putative hemolysin
VVLARRSQAPHLVDEVGRLREISFRAVGEGTGRERDLDVFDDWYWQMVVVDDEHRRVLGAYRLCMTDVVQRQYGASALYTRSLFDYEDEFLERLGPALELGRSFVRPELQGGRVLALLWRGIGQLVASRPRYRNLFGPVSVSASYTERSRRLIVTRLSREPYRHDLAGTVVSLRPVPPLDEPIARADEDVRGLSRRVAQGEPDQKGLPVLVREYLKLGGKFLSFSVDPDFGNALDGLVAVDLDRTSPRLLALYMGAESYRKFRGQRALMGRLPTSRAQIS